MCSGSNAHVGLFALPPRAASLCVRGFEQPFWFVVIGGGSGGVVVGVGVAFPT